MHPYLWDTWQWQFSLALRMRSMRFQKVMLSGILKEAKSGMVKVGVDGDWKNNVMKRHGNRRYNGLQVFNQFRTLLLPLKSLILEWMHFITDGMQYFNWQHLFFSVVYNWWYILLFVVSLDLINIAQWGWWLEHSLEVWASSSNMRNSVCL